MRIFINMGALSDDNGAHAPGRVFHDLAKALKVEPRYGDYWGQDSLEIAEKDWPIAKELLDEARMLYRVEGLHETWQNVRTDPVRQRLAISGAQAQQM